MTKKKEIDPAIVQALKDNNPFSTNAAGDPREDQYPDVTSVDQATTDALVRLIAQKQKKPGEPKAATVLGESGVGKTHLIGRLVRKGNKGPSPFSFAYVLPFIDHHQAFRYLLKEIVCNLNNKTFFNGKYSQLEYICGSIFSKFLFKVAEIKKDESVLSKAEAFRNNPPEALSVKLKNRKIWLAETKKFLLTNHDNLHNLFLKVLLQYFFYPDRRLAALGWLKGNIIDEDDCKLLGIPDRVEMTPLALEEEAKSILASLDKLLSHYSDRPLVVFFDQLENFYNNDLIQKFSQIAFFLSDQSRAMLPIAFFRGKEWESKVKEQLDAPTRTRFENNLFELNGCDKEQSLELIRLRLDFILSNMERPDPLYPFLPDYEEELNKLFTSKFTFPRQVINRANDLLKRIVNGVVKPPPPKKSIIEILEEAYEVRYKEILTNLDQYPPDESRLTLALELFLGNRPATSNYTASKITRSKADVKYLDLTAEIILAEKKAKPFPTAFLIDVEQHHKAVAAGLKRGIQFLDQNGRAKGVFIRDKRCPFPEPPSWPATNKLLESFRKKKGGAIFLDERKAAYWYALALLKFDVESGDVTCEDGTTVGSEYLSDFISTKITGQKYAAFKELDDYIGVVIPPPDNGLCKKIKKILMEIPPKMAKAELLAKILFDKFEIQIETDTLLVELRDCPHLFSFIKAKDGILVKLKLG